MRTHKPVSVSLPPELFQAAEDRAAKLGFKRATYIQQLILADLKRAAQESPAPLPTSSSSEEAPKPGRGKKK